MEQHKQAKNRLLAYLGTLAIVATSTSGYALASEQSLDDPQSLSTAVETSQSDERAMSDNPSSEQPADEAQPESQQSEPMFTEDETELSSDLPAAPEAHSPRRARKADTLSKCSYANEGSGAYAQSLCWIDMTGLTTRYSTAVAPAENTTCSSFGIWPFRQYTCEATARFSSDLGSQYGTWERSFSRTASTESAARSAVIAEFESALSQSQEIYRDNSGEYWGSIKNYPIDIPLSSSLSFTASVNISLNQQSLSSRGLAIAANVIPLGAWAGLGNHGVYTGITGKPALEHQINGPTRTVTDVTLSNIKLVNTKTGASVKDFSMVTADAEVTTAGEKITWSHTGGNGFTWLPNDPDAWAGATSNEARKIAAVGNGCQGTDTSAFSANSDTVSTSTKTCDGGSATGPRTGSAMLQISPNSTTAQFSVTQTMWGGGNEGIAFGILTARAQVNVEVAERIVDTNGVASQTDFRAQLVPNGGGFGQDDAVTASTGSSATTAAEDMTVPATTNEGRFQFDFAVPDIADPYFSSYTPNWTCSKTTSQSRVPIPWPQNGTALAPQENPPDIGTEWMRLGPGEFMECTVTYLPPYITLVKEVDSTFGGNATPSAWTLSGTGALSAASGTTGSKNVTRVPVAVGDYAITESGGPSQYNWTNFSCNPGAAATVEQEAGKISSAQVRIARLANTTCTLTNSFSSTTLTLTKEVENSFGGTATPNDWTLQATGGDRTISGKTGTPDVTGVSVAPGEYRLSETGSLQGYVESWQCLADGRELEVQDGTVNIPEGSNVTCTATNRDQSGSVTWTKVNASNTKLSGSEWVLKGVNLPSTGLRIADCTEGNCSGSGIRDINPGPGEFTLEGLSWGSYELVEAVAPAGYQRDTTQHPFTIGGDENSAIAQDLGAIVNNVADAPTLPHSGGIGRDAFFLIGLAILAIGSGTAFFTHKKRREVL